MDWMSEGWALVAGRLSAEDCDLILSSVEQMDRVGTRSLLGQPWCAALAVELQRRLTAELPELAELRPVQCTFFSKDAGSNWFVAYHQDRSIPVAAEVAEDWPGRSIKEGMDFVQGPDEVMDRMVALRLHLDDCAAENGPLRVLPGSHRHGTLSPERIEELRQATEWRELVVERGDVVAMRPMLLHASPKSRSEAPRRVLHFLFGPRQLPAGLAWGH